MTRILIVEDEPDMRRGLEDNLQFEGYATVSTSNGLEGLRLARQDKFDLIILDLMLPGMDGLDLCRQLKREGSSTPIIMLTAKGSESDRVMGLEVGADDYITKPFSLRELLARVKAILRRSGALSSLSEFQFDDIYLHFGRYEATKGGRPLQLSPREFEILRLLAEHRGEIVTRERFLEEVWGYESAPSTRTVDNHIAKLRQKIEADPDNPKYIITVHRMGYKFAL
ncbi:MAG TPA: response regulator transcription factor [bacterium]|nr:response regulator transcription factor [bacterium]HQL63876.1 response regulator transcription factor [bacterium]